MILVYHSLFIYLILMEQKEYNVLILNMKLQIKQTSKNTKFFENQKLLFIFFLAAT